ncbi:shikimate dehydrogenase family protein [Polymorphobacter fuscus]|uniref:Shikimate dehydrogenase (NADP(+)) n=1 Tax=Sandarakinorhabdus fusca TaxID=1439888 RepID=A0A7C9GR76_9SPHN|nr:shikimate dehydrogenase [Polymorphobacter fuscus]KAB7647648.1 shikimate dehydrogenase [Polymorphobacter fuscus]MQT16931.1 shikimate dehydrogenase [Polymorphobacter fuscus]NJC09079.1 shikimate dehydrogenase [Polymorphobacter fuscus]
MTRLQPASAGIFGWPVAHSKSPVIHRFWLGKLGLDGDYSRFPVHPDALGAAIRALPALGLRGVNITVPHKIAVIDHLDTLADSARAMGAVNTVTVTADGSIAGANTDIDGVLEPIAHLDLAGRSVMIAGTGGAARAAITAAVVAGAASVTVLARDRAKGEAMLANAGTAGSVLAFDAPWPDADQTALFFNATSLGMAGQPPLPVDLSRLPVTTTVFDAVYAPLETPLLAAARARTMPVIDGLQMLVGQAATAFAAFYDAPAPRQHDAELRALLTR